MNTSFPTEGMERIHVSEVLFTKANEINPAFTFGRQSERNGVLENFVLGFFLNCSPKQLQEELNPLVEAGEDDVLVKFFLMREDGSKHILSEEEMKSFDFSRPWSAKRQALAWDEERDRWQACIAITFF